MLVVVVGPELLDRLVSLSAAADTPENSDNNCRAVGGAHVVFGDPLELIVTSNADVCRDGTSFILNGMVPDFVPIFGSIALECFLA